MKREAALAIVREIDAFRRKYDLWQKVEMEHKPDLRMITVSISIKVDEPQKAAVKEATK